MPQLAAAQSLVYYVLGALAFLTQLLALIDAMRRRPDAFIAAGKMTKQRWLIILGVATAIGFISLGGLGALGILNIAAFVAAAVYHVDVKPALKQVSGGGGSRGVSGPW